jgi:hypothetical protein
MPKYSRRTSGRTGSEHRIRFFKQRLFLADGPGRSFFRYCHLHCSKTRPDPQEDAMLRPVKSRPSPRLGTAATATATATPTDGEEEIELITEYSWRNFFSTINFLKVLQKMTKHRSHRTYMLQQYKSTVRRSRCWASGQANADAVYIANPQADAPDQSSHAATTVAETHQEPDALVWPQMASR